MWAKTEDSLGDIKNRKQAEELTRHYCKHIDTIQQRIFGNNFREPDIAEGTMQKMKERFNLEESKPAEIVKKMFDLYYYPKLINFLSTKNIS